MSKKLNQVLIIFLVVVSVILVGFWQLLRSKYFAKKVSVEVSRILEKETNLKLAFSNIIPSVFPPGVILTNVEMDKIDVGQSVYLSVKEFGVYFNLFDFFSNKISVSKLVLSNGTATYKKSSNTKQKVDLGNIKIPLYNEVRRVIKESLPFALSEIQLNEMLINTGEDDYNVKRFTFKIYRHFCEIDIELRNLTKKILNRTVNVDTLRVTFQYSNKEIEISKLSIKKGLSDLNASGTVLAPGNIIKDITLNVKSTIKSDLRYLQRIHKKIKVYIPDMLGYLIAKVKVSGKIFDPQVIVESDIRNFKTTALSGKELKVVIAKKDNKILIQKIKFKNDLEEARLLKPFHLYDLENGTLIDFIIDVRATKLKTSSFLKYINKVIYPFKGELTGELVVLLKDREITFRGKEQLRIDNLKVKLKKEIMKHDLLSIKQVFLDKTSFILNIDSLDLNFESEVFLGKTKGSAKGFIGQKSIKTNIKFDFVDLEEIGAISNIKLIGFGKLDVDVTGEYQHALFTFKAKLDDSKVLGLNLGNVETTLEYHLDQSRLLFKEFKGKHGATRYFGTGELDFKSDVKNVDLFLKFPSGTFKDSRIIYDIFMKNLAYYPEYIKGSYEAKYIVRGLFDLDKLKIAGVVKAKNITYRGELLSKMSSKFNYLNGIFSANDFMVKLDEGNIVLDCIYNTKTSGIEYRGGIHMFSLDQLRVYRESNFGVKGVIDGTFFGKGVFPNIDGVAEINFKNAKIVNDFQKDSFVKIISDKGKWTVESDIFGGMFKVDGLFDFRKTDDTSKKTSYFKASANIKDLKSVTKIVSFHNDSNKYITGMANLILNSEFNVNDIKKLDLSFMIDEFYFQNKNLLYRARKDDNNIIIENGKIKEWSVLVMSRDDYISSEGEGKLYDQFLINTKMKLDISLIELLSPKVRKSSGKINVDLNLKYDKHFKSNAKFDVNDMLINYAGIPGVIKKINIKSTLNNEELSIDKISGQFSSGKVEGKGVVKFTYPFPELNMFLSLDSIYLPLFKKSSIFVGGNVVLKGNKFPYRIGGDLNISRAKLYDEFGDFGGSGEASYRRLKYIPKNREGLIDWYDLFINIDFTNPIEVKNSLVAMDFIGKLNLKGDVNNYKMVGALNLHGDIGKNKLFFKSNDFIFNKGQMIFDEKDYPINPTLDFSAMTKMDEHKINLNISGKMKKMDVQLVSEPALSQIDILSLLTLGYTQEQSRELSEGERQALASVGIGSILLEKLKLTQDLKSNLGLKLSIVPEMTKDDDLLLNEEGEAVVNNQRSKTATKIKVEKKLGKKINISASSTFGSEAKQKQEMNLNLKLNDLISLEGVYEIKTDEESSNDASSAGADIKFKWTFK